jgi:hypothetical protein
MLKHVQSKTIAKGDKAAYKYHENTRARTEFLASVDMDPLYNVQVNKSQVDEDQIDKCLWKTVDRLRKTFVDECYKTLEPVNEQEKSTATKASRAPSKVPTRCASPETSEDESSSKIDQPLQEPAQSAQSAQSAQVSVLGGSALSHAKDSKSKLKSKTLVPAVAPPSDSESVPENATTALVADSVREVRPCVQHRIICAKGQAIMEQWRNSHEHRSQFETTVCNMIISYQDRCAADQLQDMLKFIPSIEAKYECLTHLIKKRHTSLQDDMFRGSVLLRDYCEAFGTDADAPAYKM